MIRLLLALSATLTLCGAGDLPLTGITHVAFRVSDLAKSRDFYGRVLGFAGPFEFNDNGQTTVAFMKINDRQYVELYPGLPPGEDLRLSHICLETPDIETVHKRLAERGLEPTRIVQGRAGNLLCAVKDPDGQTIEFLQYLPGSLHRNAEGKALSPDRISLHMMHGAVMVKDVEASMAFYRDKLGLEEIWRGGPTDSETRWINMRIPGGRGDDIELMLYSGKPTRQQMGGMQHICLEVPDIQAAWKQLLGRGLAESARFRPRVGRNDRWQLNLFDPDGSRVELMEPREAPSTPRAPAPPHMDRWQAVAGRLLQTPVDAYPFNWGEGVQMIGVMKIYEHTRKDAYADYVEKWAALYVPQDIRGLLALRDPQAKHPGYCGHWSPGTAIFHLYQARKKPEHLRLAEQVNGFILDGAERSPESGLGHWLGSHQFWVDTLYMACPLLSGLGKMQNQPGYIDDAANQIIVFARRLQDERTGLFYHMWDWQTGQRTADLWGRGNGWVLMSLADTLEVMDRRHKHYAALKQIAERMAAGLGQTQDADGVWHTVLDDPSSYPESSATSMFCYGLLKLARLKVLPASVRPMALKAWSAVNERYVKDGLVTGVSAGTTPKDRSYYRTVPLGSQTWGTGAYLMAGSEVVR